AIEIKKQNATGCRNASLSGNYGFTLTGFGTPSGSSVPANSSSPTVRAGLITFDGMGNFTGSFTLSQDGDIGTLPSDRGTYTVSSDCTGTLTDTTAGVNFATVILSNGAEAFGVQTDVGSTATFDFKKQ